MPGSLMIAALALGTASAPPAVGPSPAPRTTPNFVSEADVARARDSAILPETLALTNDEAQRMAVMVSVGGQGPFAFLVDTGS